MIKLTVTGIECLLRTDADLGTEETEYTSIQSLQSDLNSAFPLSRYSVYFDDDTVKSSNLPPVPYFVVTDLDDRNRIFHIKVEGVNLNSITFKL